MKKLNKKQMKQVKAGKLSGALLNGIANIIKAPFDAIAKVGTTVCGWVMGFREASKGHVKMNVKIGDANISYDDSLKVKAAENLAEHSMKNKVVNTANPKHVVLNAQPKAVELDNHHDASLDHNYMEEAGHMLENNMLMIDEFMHF